MAFPTIQTADTKNGTQTSNSTSWSLTYPTNLASGDLILAFMGIDGGHADGTFPANWNTYELDAAAVSSWVAAKISDGTETGNFTVTFTGGEQGAWRVFRITDWFGSGLPTSAALVAGTPADGNGLSVNSAAGATANPDPPNLAPANWATEDTLWFAAIGVDTSRTISVYPLASNNTADVSGGANGATLGICTTNSTVGSLNPSTFTISASDDWAALTVAIRTAGAPVTRVYSQAQADIKQTYTDKSGQAQADIKQIYSVSGQAQSDIKQTYYGLGQAQADIKALGRGLGQATALIDTGIYILVDTFTRTTGSGLGTADSGTTWGGELAYTANGSVGVLDGSGEPAPATQHGVTTRDVRFRFDFKINDESLLFFWNARPGFVNDSVVQLNISSGNLSFQFIEGPGTLLIDNPYIIGFNVNIFYRLEVESFYISATEKRLRYRAYAVGASAPAWSEFDFTTTAERVGGIAISSSLGTVSSLIDNINLAPYVPQAYGQAQADIKTVNRGLGQAQAYIIMQRYILGQAQADIKQTYPLGKPYNQHIMDTIPWGYWRLGDAPIIGEAGSVYVFAESDLVNEIDILTADSNGNFSGTYAAGNYKLYGASTNSNGWYITPYWDGPSGASGSIVVGPNISGILGGKAPAHDETGAHDGSYAAHPISKPGLLAGDPDIARSFATGTAYIETGQLTVPTIPTGNFSIAFWLTVPERDPSYRYNYMFMSNDWPTNGFAIGFYNNNNDSSYYQFYVTNGTLYPSSYKLMEGPVGTKHFVVGTFDGTTIKVYVDGVVGVPDTLTYTKTASGAHTGAMFELTADEYTVWNRAITQGEVTDLYDAGATVHGPTSGQAQATILATLISPTQVAQAQALIGVTDTLYTAIDELVPNDADYVTTNLPTGAYTSRFSLEPLVPPDYHIDYILSLRALGTLPSSVLTVKLYDAGVLRATFNPTITSTFATYEYHLTTAEINSIVNYDDLAVEFVTTDRVLVSWVELKVPVGTGVAARTVTGQAQARIKNTYIIVGQAQADIKAVGYGFAQAQADIKATNRGFGQAQADIKSQGYGLGQAQADIKAQGYALGQAQSDIKAQGYGLGQANAWIKNTYRAFGQAQANIKAVGYGFGQAQATIRGNAFGQAQADIKATYFALAQAQADIKAIYPQTGQAQADIKAIGRGFGQAQADIKAVSYALGQAQASIRNTYIGTGQTQADIKQSYYGLGQANAWIKQTYFGLGQAQADIKAQGYGLGQAQANLKATSRVYAQAQADILATYFALAQAQAEIKQVYFALGQSQADIKSIGYGFGQAQATIRGNAFGQAQGDIKATYIATGQAASWIKNSYFGLGQANAWIKQTYIGTGQAQSDIKTNYTQSGQAQSDIKHTYTVSGQAQANIKATYYGLGQAQGTIKTTYFVVAQAQAKINAFGVNQSGQAQGNIRFTGNVVSGQAQARMRSFGYPQWGQAQADIKATGRAYAQAQADIKATSVVTGQAQAWIENTYNGLAQAQADIKAIGYGLGQANAYIILTGQTAFGQAQARIKNTYYGSGNAQADILTINPRSAQAQADIKAIYYQVAQAQADIKSTYIGTGQAQARIKNTYFGLAQAQATIKAFGVTKSGQAQASIQFNGNAVFGQAQGTIKAAGRGYGQANADIKAIISQVGQAQADIKHSYTVNGQAASWIENTYSGYGQAQSQIKATYTVSGQAQAAIRRTESTTGQSQADIKSTYTKSGQANAWIKIIGYGSGQAQALIGAITYASGQAQANIRRTETNSGQSQADIKVTYSQSGQVNAKIILVQPASGQAQATILLRNRAFGQAQAWILQTSRVSGNAQSIILAAVNSYGQAQAQILQQGYQSGQAQAQITSGTMVFGQAQALIFRTEAFGQAQALVITTHTLKNLEVSDDTVISTELSDDAEETDIVVEDTEDEVVLTEITFTITLSDDTEWTTILEDEAF